MARRARSVRLSTTEAVTHRLNDRWQVRIVSVNENHERVGKYSPDDVGTRHAVKDSELFVEQNCVGGFSAQPLESRRKAVGRTDCESRVFQQLRQLTQTGGG